MAFVSQKRTSVGKWLLVQSLMALTAAVFLCKAHQDCYNGGTWKNGTCLCNDGFTGKFCEKDACVQCPDGTRCLAFETCCLVSRWPHRFGCCPYGYGMCCPLSELPDMCCPTNSRCCPESAFGSVCCPVDSPVCCHTRNECCPRGTYCCRTRNCCYLDEICVDDDTMCLAQDGLKTPAIKSFSSSSKFLSLIRAGKPKTSMKNRVRIIEEDQVEKN